MAVVGNFYFSIFFRLTWEFLDLESERRGFVCRSNNKIIDNSIYIIKKCLVFGGPAARTELTNMSALFFLSNS
jgi:hypothetical protein